MAYNTFTVANRIIDLAPINLSLLKLLKLVYIAHGWTLGLTRKSLINDTVEAWKYGPVIPCLYQAYKEYGDRTIDKKITTYNGCEISKYIGQTENAVIEKVVEKYGDLTALQLSSLTHLEGTPWYKSWHILGGKYQQGFPISNELIEDHYVRQATS